MRPLDGTAANIRNHTDSRVRHYLQQGGNRPIFRRSPDYRLNHIGQARPLAKVQTVGNDFRYPIQFGGQVIGLPVNSRPGNQRGNLFSQAVNACQQISLNKRGGLVFAHRAFRLSQLFSLLIRLFFRLLAVLLVWLFLLRQWLLAQFGADFVSGQNACVFVDSVDFCLFFRIK